MPVDSCSDGRTLHLHGLAAVSKVAVAKVTPAIVLTVVPVAVVVVAAVVVIAGVTVPMVSTGVIAMPIVSMPGTAVAFSRHTVRQAAAANAFPDLQSMHGNVVRCFKAQPHAAVANPQHGNCQKPFEAVYATNNDCLPRFPR